MVGLISGVRKNSLAADAGIKAGEKLCSVDGVQVKDIIELSFYTSDYEVELEIEATDGTRRQVHIEKYLMRILAWSLIPQFLTELRPATITVFSALLTR